MTKIKNLLKTAGENLLVIIIGAIGGAIISVLCGLHFWLPTQIAALPSGLGAWLGELR